jgi:hypothetical protein
MGILGLLCASAVEISLEEAEKIGQGIYFNECSGKKEKLVWWNAGEEFASLGIGHFIWYPEGNKGPYQEVFPELVVFLQEKGVEVPQWVAEGPCPWKSRKEWSEDARKRELEELLSKTVALQAVFIAKRCERAVEKLLGMMGEADKKKIDQLCLSTGGKFALIDYLNFKGDGTLEAERYQGVGWGLRQVVEKMDAGAKDPVAAFCGAAKDVLKERVKNAPPERKEERWLTGWLARVERYLKS